MLRDTTASRSFTMRLSVRALGAVLGLACAAAFMTAPPAAAQVAGQNVNMVSGTKWPTGDPFLQRQNEPSMAVSTRNPMHILAGANNYRSVDLEQVLSGGGETGDAWLAVQVLRWRVYLAEQSFAWLP